MIYLLYLLSPMSDKRFNIGLTGSRKSGKDGVASLFKQLGVAVFDADAVLKYLLNYDPNTIKSVKDHFPPEFILSEEFINPIAFDTDEKFLKLIDLVQFELFEAYHRFREKTKGKHYTIFHSSLIFEKNIGQKFDYVINVYTPKEQRVYRYKQESGDTYGVAHNLFSRELSDICKNQKSDFIIHNYDAGPDILKQVTEIDSEIIKKYSIFKSKNRVDDDIFNSNGHLKNILTF